MASEQGRQGRQGRCSPPNNFVKKKERKKNCNGVVFIKAAIITGIRVQWSGEG